MKGSFVFAAYATLMIGIAAASAIATELVGGQLPARGAREMPARIIPVPDTVSPQLQKIIAAPINPNWRDFPKTGAEWKAQVDTAAAAAVKALPALRSQLHVKTEPVTIDGVRAFMVTPDEIPP